MKKPRPLHPDMSIEEEDQLSDEWDRYWEWRKKWTDRAWVAAGVLSMVVYVGFMVYAAT
jgi:hypothetical protein